MYALYIISKLPLQHQEDQGTHHTDICIVMCVSTRCNDMLGRWLPPRPASTHPSLSFPIQSIMELLFHRTASASAFSSTDSGSASDGSPFASLPATCAFRPGDLLISTDAICPVPELPHLSPVCFIWVAHGARSKQQSGRRRRQTMQRLA